MRFKVTGACIESELLWAGPPPFERSPSCGLVLPYWWLAGGLGERERDRGRCHGQWRQWMLGGQGRGRSYPGVISRWGHGGANIQTEAVLAQSLCAICRTDSFEEFAARRASMVKLLRACCGNIRAGCRVSPTLCVSCSRVYSDCLQGIWRGCIGCICDCHVKEILGWNVWNRSARVSHAVSYVPNPLIHHLPCSVKNQNWTTNITQGLEFVSCWLTGLWPQLSNTHCPKTCMPAIKY